MNLLFRVYIKAAVRPVVIRIGSAASQSGAVVSRDTNFCGMRPPFTASKGKYLPGILNPACPPLTVITGRQKSRSPPGEPFRGARGP